MSTGAELVRAAMNHHERGELEQARRCYREALSIQPAWPEAWRLLAVVQGQLGAFSDSLASAERALELQPRDVEALRCLAQALYRMGRLGPAFEAYERLLALTPGDASAWHSSSVVLSRAGRPVEAHVRAARAAELAPHSAKYVRQAALTASLAVPDWHFNMMNDERRNQAFADAIRDQVRAEQLVLEIGTGSGLLAMLAAGGRDGQGARRVVTCEVNPVIAQAARRIIADNGLSERVTVVNKPSSELVVGVDLPERADLLVAEIFTVQVVAEGALPSLEDAKARLLKPNARILPSQAIARGALVSGDALGKMARVDRALGFDLSAFNAYAPRWLHLGGRPFEWLSEPADLLRFDFQNEATFPSRRHDLVLEATHAGVCEGVVQWLKLELGPSHDYEIVPDPLGAFAPAQHWSPVWYPFARPLRLSPGSKVRLGASHNRFGMSVELAGVS